MAKIVGIGAAVCDTLLVTGTFPMEDTKMRAESTMQSGGGPCATGLVAAAKLGESASFLGNLTDDPGGAFLMGDFARYGVDTSLIRVKPGYRSFTSYIILNQAAGTRTCIFDRGTLPGTILDEEQKKAIREAEILMVDGNDLSCAVEGAKIARESGTKVLYDAGGLYEGIEGLLPYADYLIPSEEFALGLTGCSRAEDAARELYRRYSPEAVAITQGKRGGICFDGGEIRSYPIYPAEVVDSNGAGDVFHGAFAAALCKGYDLISCCHFSSAVSGLKCTRLGARAGAPSMEAVSAYLNENRKLWDAR